MIKNDENSKNQILKKAIANADEVAFEQLFTLLYQDLFASGFRLCADKELTKDAIQELFLELWQKRNQLSDIQNVKAYFQTSLRRKIIRKIKEQRKKNYQSLDDNIREIAMPSYEKLLIAAQDEISKKTSLQNALKSLSPQQSEMLQLRFFKEMSYQNIAEKTGKSKQTIYNQVFDAIKKLRKIMTMFILFFI